ncbi:MAG: substrate-binding domain-containing protein [Blautia sp.]
MTLRELSKEIGCSRATLDRVLHNRPGVSQKRRQKILQQIENLGYKPNRIGTMLAKQKRTVIGIILCADITAIGNPLFHIIAQGMEEAVKDLEQTGVSFLLRHLKSGKASEQIQVIDELVQECGVSGIALSLEENTDELYEVIQKYMDRGVRFVSYFNINGVKTSDFSFAYSLGIDQKREGYVAAGLMAKFIQGKGKVALLSGLEKNQVHQLRMDYAKEYLEREYPEIEVLPIFRNCFPKEVVEDLTEQLMTEQPDLSGIILSCGFSNALIEKIRDSKFRRQLSIIVFDLTSQNIKELERGESDAVIGVDLKMLGFRTVHAIYDYIFQNAVRQDILEIPLQLYLKELIMNLDE